MMINLRSRPVIASKAAVFRYFISIGICLLFVCVRFWPFFSSQAKLVIGDNGDPRFIYFGLEHIYQSLQGSWSIMDPPMFYPLQGTIARSDWSLSLGLIYSLYRFLGVNNLVSFELTMISAIVAYYSFSVCALTVISRLNILQSSLFSALITFFGFTYDYRFWLQNYSVFIIPLIFLSLFFSFKKIFMWVCRDPSEVLPSRYKYLLSIFLTGLLNCLLLFSCYYIGLGSYVLGNTLLLLSWSFYGLRLNKLSVNTYIDLLIIFFVFNIGIIVFAILHIDVFKSSLEEFSASQVVPLSITIVPSSYMGFAVFGITAFIALVFMKRNLVTKMHNSINHKFITILCITCFLFAFIFYPFFPSSIVEEGALYNDVEKISLLSIFYYQFSPLNSIRDYGRFFFPFYYGSCLIIGYVFATINTNWDTKLSPRVLVWKLKSFIQSLLMVLLLVVTSQKFVNDAGLKSYPHNLNAEQQRLIWSESKRQLSMQGNCEAFYLVTNSSEFSNHSAITIAIDAKVPSLNGITGAMPNNSLIAGRDGPDMSRRVQEWINKHKANSSNICKVSID